MTNRVRKPHENRPKMAPRSHHMNDEWNNAATYLLNPREWRRVFTEMVSYHNDRIRREVGGQDKWRSWAVNKSGSVHTRKLAIEREFSRPRFNAIVTLALANEIQAEAAMLGYGGQPALVKRYHLSKDTISKIVSGTHRVFGTWESTYKVMIDRLEWREKYRSRDTWERWVTNVSHNSKLRVRSRYQKIVFKPEWHRWSIRVTKRLAKQKKRKRPSEVKGH